ISPDKKRFLTGSRGGKAWLWNEKGDLIRELPHQYEVWGGNFSPDNTTAVTSGYDRTVRVWDSATGHPLTPLPHRSDVFSVTFTPDSKRVLTGSRDGAQMWDVQLRRRVGPSQQGKDLIMTVALSPDGKIAMLGDWRGYGWLWTLP